jgi:hypothetical protein
MKLRTTAQEPNENEDIVNIISIIILLFWLLYLLLNRLADHPLYTTRHVILQLKRLGLGLRRLFQRWRLFRRRREFWRRRIVGKLVGKWT